MLHQPKAGRLRRHGYPAEFDKWVHLPRANNALTRRTLNQQTWVIFPVPAHAFHDQKLAFDQPRFKHACQGFKRSGHGNPGLFFDISRIKHYRLSDEKEFFARTTASFFQQQRCLPLLDVISC